MAISLQINSGLSEKAVLVKKSSFKSVSCKARTVAMQSGKANYYQVLSLESYDVSVDEIKKAYRCKALKFHPDSCPSFSKQDSTKRFVEIRLAYETLSDPVSREMYDCEFGLSDQRVGRYGSWSVESRKDVAGLSRRVWETQLHGLKERSKQKLEKRRNQCVNL